MAVTIADISKLRKMTGAGLVDCKKALIEADNDLEKAIELIRKRGQAIAAKREDRNAAEGVAFAKSTGDFAAIVAVKCETDFVASNEKFVSLAKKILDAAVEAKVKTLDELNNLALDGKTVAENVTALSGITGEKMEVGAYECLAAPSTAAYNHFNKKLATIVAFNQASVDPEVAKSIAMQVASMNPIAATREQIPQATVDEESKIAREKAEESKKPAAIIDRIVEGSLNKFYQENVLMEQEYEADPTLKTNVAGYLAKSNKDLKAIDLKRVNLNVD
jgi:elongation factor Ts